MPNALPPDVIVQSTTNGVLYLLPTREVGWLRHIASLILILGLTLIGLALYLVLIPTGLFTWLMDQWSTGGQAGGFDFTNLFTAFMALPCLFFGIPLLKLGRFLFGGRSAIELRGDQLITTQGSGLMRRRKKYAINKIKKLQVKTGRPGDTPSSLSDLTGALNITLANGKTRNLTWGYKQELLLALATDLSAQCEQLAGTALFDGEYQSIGIEQRTLGDDDLVKSAFQKRSDEPESSVPYETPLRPDDAASILERHSDGLTITVPPVGIAKGSKGLFGFSLFWNLFMIVFTVGAMAGGAMTDPDAWVFWIVIPVFWAVGIGLLLAAINAGRRQAILDVVGGTLLITRQSIYKTRQEEVHRNDIKSIRRAPSGTEVNDVPLMNLRILLRNGKRVAMLGQLENDELTWIAAELSQALKVDAHAEEEAGDNGSGIVPKPPRTVAIMEQRDDGITLTIPRVGILKGSKGLLGFSIFWNGFMLLFTGALVFSGALSYGMGLIFVPFLALFWAIGLFTLYSVINTGRRQAILDVVGDTLLVSRKNLFKTQQQKVHRDQIKSICKGPSGTKINDVPVMELHIRRSGAKKIAMLSQLSDDELAWIASELRAALGVPAK